MLAAAQLEEGSRLPLTLPPPVQSMYQGYGSPSQYGMAGSYGSATPQQPAAPQHQGTLNQVTPSPRLCRVPAGDVVCECC